MTRYTTGDGAFEVTSMPGQCQVALCHGFFIDEKSQGNGNGLRLKKFQNDVLRDLLYDYALCTVSASNHRQKAVLVKAGWRCVDTFWNRRLSETTEVWASFVDRSGDANAR